jgi:FkbM family methyltransferase
MDYTNPVLMGVRKVGQSLGILRPLVRTYRHLRRSSYEEKFDRYLVSHISTGDVVWDVGANIGYFTAKFAHAAGKEGRIVAFEPSAGAFSVLRQKFARAENIVLENIALADFDGEADFAISDDPTDVTNGLAVPGRLTKTVKVRVRRGASYLADHPDRFPDRIKIDVEGFELEVLHGMSEVLHRVKSVFIEVHFQILRERGLARGPGEIKSVLEREGFSIRWVDPSHLVAERIPGLTDGSPDRVRPESC